MRCPKCYGQLPGIANYCHRCGSRLLAPYPNAWRWARESISAPDLDGEWFIAAGKTLLGSNGKWLDEDLYLLESRSEYRILGAKGRLFWIFNKIGQVLASYGPDCETDGDYSTETSYELREGTLIEYSTKSNDSSYRLAECRVSEVLQVDYRLEKTDPRLTALISSIQRRPMNS